MLPTMHASYFPNNTRSRSSISITSTSSSFSTGHAIHEYRHATPPRHNDRALPSSPSSTRLRRVAPSPLNLTTSSRLRLSPVSPDTRSASTSPSTSEEERRREGVIQGRQLQYDLHVGPRAYLGNGKMSAFAQAVAEANLAKMGPPRIPDPPGPRPIPGSNSGSGSEIRADASGLTSSSRSTRGDMVRDEDGAEGQEEEKEDWTKLTRGEWIRANIPREVMVNFRTDVFGPQSPTEEDGAGPASHTYSPSSQPRIPDIGDRVPIHGSFATFGRNRSQGSVITNFTMDHARRETAGTDADAFSISMYDRDDNRHQPDQPRSPTDVESVDWKDPLGVEVPIIFPGYTEDSPASVHTELVTPEHDALSLPYNDSEEEDTPTKPKPRIHHKSSGHGLLLDLNEGSTIRTSRTLSDTIPDPDAEADESWRKANAGVTPSARGRKQVVQDQGSAGYITIHPPPPPVPSLRILSPPSTATSFSTSSASFSTSSASVSTTSTVKPTKALKTSTSPDDLANFDKSLFLEIHVDNGKGQPGWKTTLPFRRTSKPEVWQEKEEEALSKAWKWNDRPAKPQPFQQTGCVIFGQPPRQRDRWVFGLVDHGPDHDDDDCPGASDGRDGDRTGCIPLPMPSIRSVNVGGDSTRDYMTNNIELDIDDYGVYHVSGNDRYGRVQWQFEYLVIHQTNYQGDILPNQRIVCPLYFYAATSFFESPPPAQSPTSIERSKGKRPSLVSERLKPPRIGTPPKPQAQVRALNPKVFVAPVPIRLSPKSPSRHRDRDRHERCESSPPQQSRPELHRHLDVRAIRSALSTPIPSPLGTEIPIVPIPAPVDNGASGVCISTTISAGNSGTSRKSPPSGNGPGSGSSGSGSGSGDKTPGIMSGFLHKFGSKSKSSGRSTPKSQSSSPALPNDPTMSSIETAKNGTGLGNGSNRAESVKSSKTTRARATSLLSRMTRPFTPPTTSVFDMSLSSSMSKDLPPNPPVPTLPTGPTGPGPFGHKSRMTPMRSFASLRPSTPPRFENSPPVPALPAGLILVRPKHNSKSFNPSSLANQHPLTTALRPIDPPNGTSNLGEHGGGGGPGPQHYITVSCADKIRPVSSSFNTQAVYLGLGFGQVSGLHSQNENVYPTEIKPGGLHPPRRPNLRKRPSTADPIVNPSGRLVSVRDSPQCL